jgi:hypothetical protein
MTTLSATHLSPLIVIDSRVTDWKSLINDVNPNTTILVLDPTRDGLTQIAEANYTNIDAIHILSHGNVGSLELGSSTLDSRNLGDYHAQLTSIGNALSPDGDILLYGCHVAQGVVGQRFVQQLSDMTGATIAASTNLTGAENLGGDWTLEFTTGSIRATALNVPSYAGVLTAPTIGVIPTPVNFTEAGGATLIDSTITFTGGGH